MPAGDAAARASVPRPVFFFWFSVHADSATWADSCRTGLTCADSVCIGHQNRPIQAVLVPNQPIQAEIQKKKKKERCKTHCLAVSSGSLSTQGYMLI